MTIRKFQLARGLIFFTLLSISALCAASEADLKPGDTIRSAHNWQKVQGMVGAIIAQPHQAGLYI